jgi:tetratricopeptide (TPR) repeat protein
MRRRLAALACATVLVCMVPAIVRADGSNDCFGEDLDRRIQGCTDLILNGDQSPQSLSVAYAMRALAFSLKGQYANSIPDYNTAIRLNPDFAVALNNRAWAYFRWGRGKQGLPDVEKSLRLNPTSAHSFDTRAHIFQSMGQTSAALSDYDQAMYFGGQRMIRLYQCGLTEQGLYKDEVDGKWRPELQSALEACVENGACDPLPADEQCRAATS